MIIEAAIDALASGKQVALDSDPFQWGENWLTSFVEFGTPTAIDTNHLTKEEVSRHFTEIKDWIGQVAGPKRNAVYLDTTTIYTASAMVVAPNEGELFVVPSSLLDLSNFVNSVVLFDHVFYLENRTIDSYGLNQVLGGDPIFISLPVESFGFSRDNDSVNSVGGLLRSLWHETDQYIVNLRRSGRSEVALEDAEGIKSAWRSTIDFPEVEELWFDPERECKNSSYHSDGPRLLAQLTDISHYQFQEVVYQRMSEDKPKERSRFAHRVIDECNYRSLFNTMVSNSLQLHYIPNTFRLPFRNFFHSKAIAVQRHLPSLRGIEKEYGAIFELYADRDQNELRMPFFLAAVLNQISTLDEFFDVLANVRRKAGVFREHRRELDDALERNSLREAKRLRKAMQEEGESLRITFPFAPIAGGLAAVLAAFTGSLSHTVLATIGILTAGSQFSSHYERLKERALRPQYRFLTNMKDLADGLTASYPVINKLWHLDNYANPQLFQTEFHNRLKNLRSLDAP